jgi:hypothetical protein
MWYHAMDTPQWDAGHGRGSICYATSQDGIVWHKPELGLVAYQGDRKNNIVLGHGANGVSLGQDGGMVFLDPTAPAGERFRLVSRFGEGCGCFRPVTVFAGGRIPPSSARPQAGSQLDSQNVIFWDETRKIRGKRRGRARNISRAESAQLVGFLL